MNYLATHLWLFGSLTALFIFFTICIQIVLVTLVGHSLKTWKGALILIGFALTSFAASACGIAFLIGLIGWILKN